MGFWSKLFSKVTIIHPSFGAGGVGDYNSTYDPSTNTISTLLACEKILSEQLSKLPLEIYKSSDSKGKQKNKQHPLYRLLHNKPNRYQTSTLFFQQLEKWRNHYGNAFAKIHRDATGKVTRLEQIHPKQITGYKVLNGRLYFYRDGAETEVISNDDMLHFRFISEDGIFGLNPVQALFSELDNIYQGKQTLNKSYKNGLNVDKVIESDFKNFNSANAKAALDEVKKEFSGSQNAKGVPMLPGGFKLTPIQSGSIQDAQILDSLSFSKKDIAALYGVPPHLIGQDGGSYNSIEQNTLNFKSNTLQPTARMYRQELESKLLTDGELDEEVSIEFNINALVETDMGSRVAYFKAMHGMGAVTANDIAKMEGFDTYKNGDKHFIQSQYIPVEDYELFAKNRTKEVRKENE